MVSVFVIVSNFFINRVGKVGPSSHSSVGIPETSAASHTDQGKEAQWVNHKANKVRNIQLVELLFVVIIIIINIIIIIIIILILVYILFKGGLKIATDTLLQVVCATISILYQNLLIFVIYPQPSNKELAQDSKIIV